MSNANDSWSQLSAELRRSTATTIHIAGIGLLKEPARFIAYIWDVAAVDGCEVLSRCYDSKLASYFFDAAAEGTADSIAKALKQGIEYLYREEAIDPNIAFALCTGIARGIADALEILVAKWPKNVEELVLPEAHCPSCGARLMPTARFCTMCGTQVAFGGHCHEWGASSRDMQPMYGNGSPEHIPQSQRSVSYGYGSAYRGAPSPANETAFDTATQLQSPQAAYPSMPSPSPQPQRRFSVIERIRSKLSGLGHRDDNGARACENMPTPTTPTLDLVQFKLIVPRTVSFGRYATIDVVMFQDEWKDSVEQIVLEHSEPVGTTDSGWLDAEQGTQVRVDLSSPELGSLGSSEGIWAGRYLRFGFHVLLSEGIKTQQILFEASVLFGGVPATRLSFVASVMSDSICVVDSARFDIRTAFMSYASQDRARVATIMQGIETVRPDLDVFMDVESLRSGERWKQAIEEEIRRRDTLFLCWSKNAQASPWVNYEWRYALRNKGLGGIEPVAIDSPNICPPPKELSSKHFNSHLLHLIAK